MNIGNTKVVAITVYQGSPTASLRISLNNAHHLLHPCPTIIVVGNTDCFVTFQQCLPMSLCARATSGVGPYLRTSFSNIFSPYTLRHKILLSSLPIFYRSGTNNDSTNSFVSTVTCICQICVHFSPW